MGDAELKVLLTVPSLAPEFGGPVDVAAGLRAALRKRGVEVRLVGAGPNGSNGLPVLTTVRGTPVPRSFRTLRSAIRGADVVHILGYRDPVGTMAASAAPRSNVPYLLEPCGMHRPRLRSIAVKRVFDAVIGRRIVDGAALVVATSELERRELIDDGVPDVRIRTRMNGLTLPVDDLPPRGHIRSRFGVPEDSPLVLSLGRIARKKGLADLLWAVSRLPNVQLLIVGPDSRDGTLEELTSASRTMDGRVHIDPVGMWGMDKLAALADADCFALPSLTENFGNAAAEAAAVGVPVVVSDACGVAEILGPTAHRVVSLGRPDELTDAIAHLVTPQARSTAGIVARDIRSRLDWSRLVEEQLAMYKDVRER